MPDYTGGGGVVNAGALEDSYIELFKARDPRAVRLWEYAEILYNAGKLTADDVAGFINDVPLYIDKIAYDFERVLFSIDFIAKVLDSPNLSADKAASILNNANLSTDKAISILDNANLSADKAALILNSVNFSIDNAVRVCVNNNLSPSRIVSIFKSANLVANKIQDILYSMVDYGYYDRLLEIMTCDAFDQSITADTTWSDGVNRVHNLSIDSGVTLTLGSSPGVIIADTITNNGNIVSGWVKGGGGNSSHAGDGGGGAGGLIILARSINVGTIHADGKDGGDGSTTDFNGLGSNGGVGHFWEIDGYPAGNGGAGGYNGGEGQKNGGGGGHEYGGDGGSARVDTFSTAKDLLNELFKCVVDWYIQNILNKTPTTVKTIPKLGGSGGGGGGAENVLGTGGGGGGGAGEIIIYGTNIIAGTVTAKGGNGGNGGAEGSRDAGGGGGGGGIIYVFYKSLTNTFTFDVSGGTGGTGDYNGADGLAGSAVTFQV